MLQINGYILHVDDYFFVHEYDGGEYLEFDISANDSSYNQITERAVINSERNNYLINKIDGSSGRYVHVSAEVDRRDFQALFYENYNNGSKKLTQAVNAFLPVGWTFINNGNTTSYRTLKIEAGTALDLLKNCASLYGVRFHFNAQTKTLTAVNPDSYEQNAAFVTEELNLKNLQYYGDSSAFITRLEARGKDGLTFEDAEIDGQTITKSYVENYTYSNDVVYGYWKDERYTVKADLYEAAKQKLAELAIPKRSYECSVIDLKAVNPDKYSAFDLSLYQRISLKDVSRETSLVYQVVKVVEYPNYPEKNVITLSTGTPKITTKLQDIETEIKDLDIAVAENSTSWLTDSDGGYIYFIRDNDGNITSQVLKVGDSANPPVWVFNKNGIGFSQTGMAGTPIVSMTANGAMKAITSFTLVDSNSTPRGMLTYSVSDGATLALFNDNSVNVATLQQNSTGGAVALGNNNGTQLASMSANSTGGAVALGNNNGTQLFYAGAGGDGGFHSIYNNSGIEAVACFVGSQNDGSMNVNNSVGTTTINLSGHTGTVTCTRCNQTSSRKVKTNIKPMSDANKILELEAMSFDYKNKDLGKNKRGFIAEEVAKILPNLVTPEIAEAPATLDYIGMIPYLQTVLKALEERVSVLEKSKEGSE